MLKFFYLGPPYLQAWALSSSCVLQPLLSPTLQLLPWDWCRTLATSWTMTPSNLATSWIMTPCNRSMIFQMDPGIIIIRWVKLKINRSHASVIPHSRNLWFLYISIDFLDFIIMMTPDTMCFVGSRNIWGTSLSYVLDAPLSGWKLESGSL